MTVLLVDDDAAWRATLGGWLEDAGMRVVRLTRGEWLTRAIETHRADAVLLDVHLPGLDGIQVLESIRARWATLPVVVMTSFGGADLEAQARRAGATAYLDKPFRMSELMEHLERFADPASREGH
jgi:DNA-binding response OmpR family regulator